MNKLLGVVSSPRRQGNTDIVVSQILKGTATSGVQTETIHLADLRINECNGCHTVGKQVIVPKRTG